MSNKTVREFYVWIVGEPNKGYLLAELAGIMPVPFPIGREKVHVIEYLAYEEERTRNAKLREALELYANSDWNFYCGCCASGETPLEKDLGKLARQALEETDNL